MSVKRPVYSFGMRASGPLAPCPTCGRLYLAKYMAAHRAEKHGRRPEPKTARCKRCGGSFYVDNPAPHRETAAHRAVVEKAAS